VRTADNLTTFVCRLSWNLGASTNWNPQGLSRAVMGLLYLYLLHRPVSGHLSNTCFIFCSHKHRWHLPFIGFLAISCQCPNSCYQPGRSPSSLYQNSIIQGVPLATEPGISLIILPLMRILQRNLKRTYLIVQEMWRHHTLHTHSFSFLTQRTYACSNFVAISSLVLELLKRCWVR